MIITRPDGSTEIMTYDTAGQLTEQVDKDSNRNILQNNRYIYDVFGEITEKTTSTEGDLSKLVSLSIEYESANRLTTYNGEKVVYDVKGNMTCGPVDGVMTELNYDVKRIVLDIYERTMQNKEIGSKLDEKFLFFDADEVAFLVQNND